MLPRQALLRTGCSILKTAGDVQKDQAYPDVIWAIKIGFKRSLFQLQESYDAERYSSGLPMG